MKFYYSNRVVGFLLAFLMVMSPLSVLAQVIVDSEETVVAEEVQETVVEEVVEESVETEDASEDDSESDTEEVTDETSLEEVDSVEDLESTEQEDEILVESNTATDTPSVIEEVKVSNHIAEFVDDVVEDIIEPLTSPVDVSKIQKSNSKITFVEKVELGVTYSHVGNKQVQVTFTKLPEVAGSLSIEEVILTPEQVKQFGAVSNVAYDITSSMENGSFEYDLKLPLPNSDKKVSKVVYAETVADLDNQNTVTVEETKVEVNTSDESVSVSDLDHFTIFVVTSFEEVQTTDIEVGYNNIWFASAGPDTYVKRVVSGTNGIASLDGSAHAEIKDYAFTRWNGYKTEFPVGGFETSLYVYLDTDEADGSLKRFDYTSAVTKAGINEHLRDFVFNIGTNGVGKFSIGASNNVESHPSDSGNRHISSGFAEVTTSGWYKLTHRFFDNGGNLGVEFIISNESDTVVGSTTITTSDLIGNVGGNRYGWFAPLAGHIPSLYPLAIDKAAIEYTDAVSRTETTLVVKSGDLQDWSYANTVNGVTSFVEAGDAPLGDGVLNLTTQNDVQDRAGLIRSEDVALEDITELKYSTKRAAGFSDAGNTAYRIRIDADGDPLTTTDTAYLVYEPYWQNGLGDSAPIVQDEWQTWDVFQGKFWASISGGSSISGMTNGAGGPPFYTINDVLALHPNAQVIGLSIGIGSYNVNYDVFVDKVVFGFETVSSSEVTTYDFEPAPLTAPEVTIIDPTPAEDSYVKGTITGRATAEDEKGMGSYYLRFWKDAFEVAGGGTLVKGCQMAPGADLLGKSVDASCVYDTTTNADGTYIFSAQFLDSDNQWGIDKREFTVDNTAPVMAFTSPTAGDVVSGTITVEGTANDLTSGIKDDEVTLHFRKLKATGSCGSFENTLNTPVVAGEWSQEFDTTALSDGKYCITGLISDNAGNSNGGGTHVKSITVDNTGPTITIKDSSLGNGVDTFRQVDFKLFDANKVDKVTINGVLKNLTDNAYSDVNGVKPGSLGAVEGLNEIVVYDVAGNTTTFEFTLDTTAPTFTVKDDSVGNGVDLFKIVSYKLYDLYKVDKVVVNGVVKDLTDNKYSDLNFLKPGTFGAVEGENTIVLYDVAGNSTTLEIVLDTTAPTVPVITKPTSEQTFTSTPIANEWSASTDITNVTYQIAYGYDDEHTFGGSTCSEVTEIDGKVVSGCRDTTNTSRNHTPALTEQGGVTIWVRASDELGNTSEWSDGVHYVYEIEVVTEPDPETDPETDPEPEPEVTETVAQRSSSGGSSSGGRISSGSSSSNSGGEVLGASTDDENGGACSMYLNTYMRQGVANDSAQVLLLQAFLNLQDISVPVTGFFGPLTHAAVMTFQTKYAEEILAPWNVGATGNVFKTTRWKINNIVCPGSEEFPII